MIFTLFTRSLSSSLYTIIVHRTRVDSHLQTNLFKLLFRSRPCTLVINDQRKPEALIFILSSIKIGVIVRRNKYGPNALISSQLVRGVCTSIIKCIQINFSMWYLCICFDVSSCLVCVLCGGMC